MTLRWHLIVPLLGTLVVVVGAATPSVAQTPPAPDPFWSEVEFPGSPAGFARAAGLDERLDPHLLLLEWARVRRLPGMTEVGVEVGSRSRSLTGYLDALERFRTLSAVVGPDVNLALARANRERLGSLLNTIGLRLTEKGDAIRVERSSHPTAIQWRKHLAAAGLQLDNVEERLNAGDSLDLKLPNFRALLPMSPEWWREAVFRQSVPLSYIAPTIANRDGPSLLYYGLFSASPETRAYLSSHPRLALALVEDHAAAFASCAGHVRIHNGSMDVPGGDAARELWEELVGEATGNPERFIQKLLGADSGRLARFYCLIDTLDREHVRFALGLHERAKGRTLRSWGERLYSLWFDGSGTAWVQQQAPFVRADLDPLWLLSQAAVDATGSPLGPNRSSLWEAAFETGAIPDRPSPDLGRGGAALDALSLIETIFGPADGAGAKRLQTFLFGQRMFGAISEAETPDVVLALRGFFRFPTLHLTLERAGIRSPSVHASAARRAITIGRIEGADVRSAALSQFQGGLALVARARLNGALSSSDAELLVVSLVAPVPDGDDAYGTRVAQWLRHQVVPVLPTQLPGGTLWSTDLAILAAASGVTDRMAEGGASVTLGALEWEGWRYNVNPARALSQRMLRLRERLHANSLDDILRLSDVTEVLSQAPSLEAVGKQLDVLRGLQKSLREPKSLARLTDKKAVTTKQALAEAARELATIKNERRLKRAGDASRFWLEPLTGLLTSDYLRSLAYSLNAPDSESPLFEDGELAARHDFGQATENEDVHEQAAWVLPDLQVGLRTGPAIKGALLGLDLALADLSIRRIAADATPAASTFTARDRVDIAQAIALFNPLDARVADTGQVAAAITRGRKQVAELASSPGTMGEVFDRAGLNPTRRSLAEWTVTHRPAELSGMFSVTELLRIGADADALLAAAAWGAPAVHLSGCLCLALPPRVDWDAFSGRLANQGVMAAGASDLFLRLAELTTALGVPPSLVPDMLPFGVLSVLYGAKLSHRDDWQAVMRHASTLPQRAVEDYVSRIVAGENLEPIGPVQ